jgi:hypothetical protein
MFPPAALVNETTMTRWRPADFMSNQSARRRVVVRFCACLLAFKALSGVAGAASLESLFNGGVVDVGHSRFSDWELVSLNSTTVPNVDLSQIDVAGNLSEPTRPGIEFDANGQLSTTGFTSIDLVLRFRVSALAGQNSFVGHELEMSGVGFGGSGGIAFISEEATDTVGGALDPIVATFDNTTGYFQLSDSTTYLPTSQITVVMNVFVAGTSSTGTVNLATFAHYVTQTGPPGPTGDYNQDGIVDAADYVLWRNSEGLSGPGLAADGDGDEVVDSDDYNIWRSNYGATLGSASSLNAPSGFIVTVPEPTSLALMLIGTVAHFFRYRFGN